MKLTRLAPDRYCLETSGGHAMELSAAELRELRRQLDPEVGELCWLIDGELRRVRVGPSEFKA